MDQIAYKCSEADETDEPSDDEEHDDDVDQVVHGFGVSHTHPNSVPLTIQAWKGYSNEANWGSSSPVVAPFLGTTDDAGCS